jgi:hypothetical protein
MNDKFIASWVLSIPASGGIMTTPKKQSDQDLLFAVELLTIPQVVKWAKVSTNSIY